MNIHVRTLSIVVSYFGLALGCSAPAADDNGDDSHGPTETSGSDESADSETKAPDTGDGDGDTGGGSMCSPQAQDCPEGEKCTFYRDDFNPSGANKCVPVMGDGVAGDPCMQLTGDSDSCAVGFHCWGTEPDNTTGACVEFCNEDAQCSTGEPCTITNSGTLPMCLPLCDPLAPDCPEAWACYDDWEYSDNWFCDRDKSEELGAHGDPCNAIAGCNPGLICAVAEVVDSEVCVSSGASGCCAVVCDISDPITCPGAAEACISYYPGTPPPQYENVGMCAIPQ